MFKLAQKIILQTKCKACFGKVLKMTHKTSSVQNSSKGALSKKNVVYQDITSSNPDIYIYRTSSGIAEVVA